MEKTAVIIGGTFNPFTIAHKQMVAEASRLFPEATIFCIPSNLNFIVNWKELPQGNVFDGKNREELIRESLSDIKNCVVSDCELSGRLSGKTYDTVKYFSDQMGYDKVVICMGSDKLFEIEKWFRAKELVDSVYKIILFTRGDKMADCKVPFIQNISEKIIEVDFDFPSVSSSAIRQYFENGDLDKIKQYVPEPVYEYLKNNR